MPARSRSCAVVLRLTLAALGALALFGCTTTQSESAGASKDRTLGPEGRLAFTSSQCFLAGCAVGPLAAGMKSRIGLYAPGPTVTPAGLRAESSDPKVATAQITPGGTVNGEKDYNLEVTALSPGAAEVRIFDSAGALFERLPLDVRRVKSFSFAQFVAVDKPSCTGCVETQTIDEVVVAVREASKAIYAQPRDEGGAQLEATSGYEFGVEDTKVARLDCVIGLCITVGEDNESVRGVAKGTTRFLVTGAGVESGLPVVVR